MRWYNACKEHECAVFFKWIYTPGNSRTVGPVRPNIQKKIRDICVHEMILCMSSTRMCCIFQRNLYCRELTHGRTGSPEPPKENKRYLRTWDDIACKVHEDSEFFKGIDTAGNSRTVGPIRRNIQMKIADICVYEMILCMESTRMCCIFQRNLYFRELTHDWTGSPEHPKENRRYLRTWDDIACKVHEDSVFFKGIYTAGTSRTVGPVRPYIQKKITDICVHEMILCM